MISLVLYLFLLRTYSLVVDIYCVFLDYRVGLCGVMWGTCWLRRALDNRF